MDAPQPTIRELIDELITRIEKLEQERAALMGAIQAFVVVLEAQRLPNPDDT